VCACSERGKLSLSLARLWNHLFRSGDAIVLAHVLESFRCFVRCSTLASDGVNVVDESVPIEWKPRFAAILSARPDAKLFSELSALPPTLWRNKKRRRHSDAAHTNSGSPSLRGYCTLGAPEPAAPAAPAAPAPAGVSASAGAVRGGSGEGELEDMDDSDALATAERVLPRIEAAVREQVENARASPALAARCLRC
jgi:hypothetical protein